MNIISRLINDENNLYLLLSNKLYIQPFRKLGGLTDSDRKLGRDLGKRAAKG